MHWVVTNELGREGLGAAVPPQGRGRLCQTEGSASPPAGGEPARGAGTVAHGQARAAQYRVIYQYRRRYSVKAMCTFFAVSRAAYYAWLTRSQQPDKDRVRMQAVQEAWEKSHRTYGYRRVALWLRQHKGLRINHKAVLRLMNKLNIRSIARQRHPYKQRARLDFHQRYTCRAQWRAHCIAMRQHRDANLSKCSAHFTVWLAISWPSNPTRNG